MPTRHAPKPLKGKTFVFTGSLAQYSRAEAKERIEALGGRATSSISGETDYLVVGDNPGSKLKEAEDLGIQTLNEDEFEELMQGV
jgi:DNA ligase (NAD+)